MSIVKWALRLFALLGSFPKDVTSFGRTEARTYFSTTNISGTLIRVIENFKIFFHVDYCKQSISCTLWSNI